MPDRLHDPRPANSTPVALAARGVRRRALTLVDVLIVLAVIVTLLAALLPALKRSSVDAGQITSMGNLQELSYACALYAWDFDDRQPTWVPDDAGLGNPWTVKYLQSVCPAQMMIGWDGKASNVIMWAYFIGHKPPCAKYGFPGNPAAMKAYKPVHFGESFGAYRLYNARAFASYVDGRFYGETFYAPNDEKTWELYKPMAQLPGEYGDAGGPPGNIVLSSYAASPAAMWNPEVMAHNSETGGSYQDPDTVPNGYQSPAVWQCAYPDLKTRINEHNWNLGAPAPVNPAFENGITPYYFNHGISVAALTLYFDGHVAELPNAQAVADDAQVLEQTRGKVGLWSRDTPFGTSGYFGEASYDGTIVSHHILTVDGILGRDILSAEPPDARQSRAFKALQAVQQDLAPHGDRVAPRARLRSNTLAPIPWELPQ